MASTVEEQTPDHKANYGAIDKAYLAIDFRNKTVFLDERGRDITDRYLTYAEGEIIIENALNEEPP